jgi:hypothetical protein
MTTQTIERIHQCNPIADRMLPIWQQAQFNAQDFADRKPINQMTAEELHTLEELESKAYSASFAYHAALYFSQ